MKLNMREKVAAMRKAALPYGAAAKAVGRGLRSKPGLLGLGLAGGSGGMAGIREMGLRQQRLEQEAQELRQFLEAYPELLNEPLYEGMPQQQQQQGYSQY
jgi:hypothetical protein